MHQPVIAYRNSREVRINVDFLDIPSWTMIPHQGVQAIVRFVRELQVKKIIDATRDTIGVTDDGRLAFAIPQSLSLLGIESEIGQVFSDAVGRRLTFDSKPACESWEAKLRCFGRELLREISPG